MPCIVAPHPRRPKAALLAKDKGTGRTEMNPPPKPLEKRDQLLALCVTNIPIFSILRERCEQSLGCGGGASSMLLFQHHYLTKIIY